MSWIERIIANAIKAGITGAIEYLSKRYYVECYSNNGDRSIFGLAETDSKKIADNLKGVGYNEKEVENVLG
ncbi:MAG: hypothetical protein LBC87_07315 [Fibromonadaceae bacterium]|jgi:hypothetical protein|nr:hypothetical protein [Fibromonadaceae bacterium]